MRILFVAGPARSGTTAFTEYLNQHPEILVCMERYMFVADKITPDFFTFERILDYTPRQGESNYPWEYHAELLARKDPAKLKWIGDKTPGFHRSFATLSQNNPGAHFIVTYRPIEEVAESFEARAKNPEDPWLGGRDGFELGVKFWNRTMQNTSQFIESGLNPNVLIISYHDFFYNNEDCIPLISRFLDLEFDESVRKAWQETSRKFEGERRQKEPLSREQAAFIEESKDYAAEERVLARIEEQWRELDVSTNSGRGASSQRQGSGAERARARIQDMRIRNLERQVEMLENNPAGEKRQRIEGLERRVQELQRRNQNLERQLVGIKESRSWRLLSRLARIRNRILGRDSGEELTQRVETGSKGER